MSQSPIPSIGREGILAWLGLGCNQNKMLSPGGWALFFKPFILWGGGVGGGGERLRLKVRNYLP